MGETDKPKSPGLLASFVGGLAFTLILIVIVPVICEHYIQPIVEEYIGNTAFMWFTSSMLVTIVMWIVLILFMVVLGGGAIVKRFGVVGVLALILAYWLMDDIYGAIIPVLSIIAVVIWQRRRAKKKATDQ